MGLKHGEGGMESSDGCSWRCLLLVQLQHCAGQGAGFSGGLWATHR